MGCQSGLTLAAENRGVSLETVRTQGNGWGGVVAFLGRFIAQGIVMASQCHWFD